jgi:hypothetical protein
MDANMTLIVLQHVSCGNWFFILMTKLKVMPYILVLIFYD